MTDEKPKRPLVFNLAYWYGLVFACIFILYGGVKIILSILDRNYVELSIPIVSLAVGVILITVAFAFKELKKWGWYGLIGVNSAVVVMALFGYSHYENLILMILSIIALYTLFSSTTKEHLLQLFPIQHLPDPALKSSLVVFEGQI